MSQIDTGSLIFSNSEELQLINQLSDQEVRSMMTLLDHPLQHPQQPQLYNTDLFKQELYQLQLAEEEEKPFQEQLQYTAVSELSPTLMPIPPAVISNEEYAGPFNFEIFIDPHHGTKNPWVFSVMLNKLFITMSNAFPIDFKWNPQLTNLYVRATPLFSLAQHAQEMVTRCLPHSMPSDNCNKNVDPGILDHVLRCQSRNAHYNGSLDNKIHLSVLVPLGTPQTGTDTVRLMYSFVCKNSCPTGMNRKPFEVVFTLEDQGGNVFGRKKLNVRVCSCPKRDKEKEEKDFQKEAGSTAGPPSGSKKRKLEKSGEKKPPSGGDNQLDTKECTFTITTFQQNKRAILDYVYGVHCVNVRNHGNTEQLQKFQNMIDEQLSK